MGPFHYVTNTKRILGAGITGINAGDLIAETALAIEMGCDVEDIALTIHPHPTLLKRLLKRPKCSKVQLPICICQRKRKCDQSRKSRSPGATKCNPGLNNAFHLLYG